MTSDFQRSDPPRRPRTPSNPGSPDPSEDLLYRFSIACRGASVDVEELHPARIGDDGLGRQALDQRPATPASTGVTSPIQWELRVGERTGTPTRSRGRRPWAFGADVEQAP